MGLVKDPMIFIPIDRGIKKLLRNSFLARRSSGGSDSSAIAPIQNSGYYYLTSISSAYSALIQSR